MERISAIQDPAILKEILAVIKAETELGTIYSFTSDERKAVDAGIKDLEQGRSFEHDEAKQLVSKWIKEQSIGR